MDSLSSLSFDSYDYFQNSSLDNKVLDENVTLPMPVFTNDRSQGSLAGRVSTQHNSKELGLFELSLRENLVNLDVQLQVFFHAKELTKRIFTVEEQMIGVVFNPRKEKLHFGTFQTSIPVIIVCDNLIPEDALRKILSKMPEGLKYLVVQDTTMHGHPVMKVFGFQ